MHEGNMTRTRALKKEHSGVDSDSGTLSELKEPATPVFPIEDVSRQHSDPLLFPLSSVELLREPKIEVNVELNAVSSPGLQKLPVRRQVKREGDGCGSLESKLTHAEFLTHNETSTLSKPAGKASSPSVEYDSAIHLESNLQNDSESVNYECMEFEPHTYFSLTELLHPDDSDQF